MTDTKSETRGFSWGRVVLAVSLAFNLLIVGMVGGAALNRIRDFRTAPMPGGGDVLAFGPYSRALTDERRRSLRAAIRRQGMDFRTARRDVRDDFDRFLAALRAQPFDAGAMTDVLETQQRRINGYLTIIRKSLADEILAMSEAERQAFADRLETVLRRGPPPHR